MIATNVRRRRVSVAVAVVGLLGLAVLDPGRSVAAPADAGAPPGARAWVARVTFGDTALIELGATSVDTTTGATVATPLTVGGQGPPGAAATPGEPEATVAMADWTDQTGSLTIQGAYGEASSDAQRWTARAGLGRSTGTGFAMASTLFTWDQQVQLLGAIQSFNDTVTPVVEQAADAVAPVLALVGVPRPRFSPMAPSGLVDAGAGRLAGSAAEAAVAPGYATARADAAAGTIKLFGGFVTVDSISSEATVERGGAELTSARSWLQGLQIAGIPVSVDADGITVLGSGPLQKILTPVLDGLLDQLAAAGVTVRAGTNATSGCCSASTVGLEVVFDTPDGPLVASLGGAEATAPAPLPRLGGAPAPAGAPPEAAATVLVDRTAPAGAPSAIVTPETPAAPSAVPGATRIGRIADLGPDVARALRLAYLILLGGGTAATAFFTVAGPTRPARANRG